MKAILNILCFAIMLSIISCSNKKKEDFETNEPSANKNDTASQPTLKVLKTENDHIVKGLIKNFILHGHFDASCQTSTAFLPVDLVDQIADLAVDYAKKKHLVSRLGDDISLRLYFGRFTDNSLGAFLGSTNTVIAAITEKKTDQNGNEIFEDIEDIGYWIATQYKCPNTCFPATKCTNGCEGALLLETIDSTSGECILKFGRVTSQTKLNSDWGNTSLQDASRMTKLFSGRKFDEQTECKDRTYSVDFDKKSFIALFKISKNKIISNLDNSTEKVPENISGVRIYFGRYPAIQTPIDKKDKVTLILTLTEQLLNQEKKPFQQDILSPTNKNFKIAQIIPLNNGSRCPPGYATLIHELKSEDSQLKQDLGCL